jgi:excinuclease UvrABC nuclease subunit
MDNAKRKTLTHSVLTIINGIGEVKAKVLLRQLGGLGAVKSATVDELVAVKGISRRDAQNIVEYFKK